MNPGLPNIALEKLDYFVEAVLLIVTFVYPWRARRGHGWRVVFYPILLGFLWGIWRVGIFDPALSNDMPGIAYFMVSFVYGVIGLFLYGVRCFFSRPQEP
jgi:hypothetical protein